MLKQHIQGNNQHNLTFLSRKSESKAISWEEIEIAWEEIEIAWERIQISTHVLDAFFPRNGMKMGESLLFSTISTPYYSELWQNTTEVTIHAFLVVQDGLSIFF